MARPILNIPKSFNLSITRVKDVDIWEFLGEERKEEYNEYRECWRELRLVHSKLSKGLEDFYHVCKKSEELEFLTRAFCKEVFSLMEVDIYLLNKLHPYPGYRDEDRFLCKFKSTFQYYVSKAPVNNKDIGTLYKSYTDRNFKELRQARNKRDTFNHPKNLDSLTLSGKDFLESCYSVFTNYDKMYRRVFVAI